MSKAWSGDWRQRVTDRVARLGFPGVLEFTTAHPGIPFGQLFRYLGDTQTADDIPIAYSQLEAVYFQEAEEAALLREAVADCFVRKLRQHLGRGWKRGKRLRERQANAVSQLELPVGFRSADFSFAMRLWDALEDVDPPVAWCPESREDPVIQEVFARVWPPGELSPADSNDN